jgi:tetratricopeptide (TPR) repeat protein
LARERGDIDRAISLLAEGAVLQKRATDMWPTNPHFINSFYAFHRNMVDACLRDGRYDDAAKFAEMLVDTFPDRLQACHEAGELMLRCAKGVDQRANGEDAVQGGASGDAASGYRRRAHELIAQAHEARIRDPDATSQFARFLVTCTDESFRDPPKAAQLAESVVQAAPQRWGAWLTLALARYRLGDWEAADDALGQLTQYVPYAPSNPDVRALLAMVRWQQGRREEARQWKESSRSRRDRSFAPDDQLGLTDEAKRLIHDAKSDEHDTRRRGADSKRCSVYPHEIAEV